VTKIKTFIDEVWVELQKASWPWDPKEKGFKRYKELVDSTVIVVLAMLLLSGYIAFWDFFLLQIVSGLTSSHIKG
jgi:preprotein translocase subunit SecE